MHVSGQPTTAYKHSLDFVSHFLQLPTEFCGTHATHHNILYLTTSLFFLLNTFDSFCSFYITLISNCSSRTLAQQTLSSKVKFYDEMSNKLTTK